MWPFSSRKHKTLSQAVLAGDLGAAREMLANGADPNKCDPDDSAWPIHYALNHGPEMVQLLIDNGADVNMPGRGNATPLAKAESRGYTEVASILRKAGARLRTDKEEFIMDPRLRLQIEPKVRSLVVMARVHFPTGSPELIADRVEEKLNLEFPRNMSPQEQESIRSDVRAIILKECGAKDYLKATVPSPEEAMRRTGLSEDELTRRFMEHLIQQGKNPFEDMPEHLLRDAETKFPDLVQLARRKFGTNR